MLRLAPHVRPRLAGLVLAVVSVAVAPAAGGAGGPAHRAQALRAREAALATKSRAAVLSLYALDSQLAHARAHLSSVSGRAASLRRQRTDVAARLTLARHDVGVAQQRLGERLRALYEQGEVDPIAIVLGASSLDEAITGLDNLDRIARGERQVLADLRTARARLVALRIRLGERQQRLDGLVAEAAATERQLATARDSRSAYVSELTRQRRLAQAQVSRLEAQARAAVAKSRTLSPPPSPRPAPADVPVSRTPDAAEATPVRPDPGAGPVAATAPAAPGPTTTDTPPPTPADTAPAATTDPGAPSVPGARTLTVTATGYSLPGHTATGLPVGWGVAAVDPSVIPLGTRMTIPGYGEAVAADVGSGVRGDMIDLWFPTTAQADAWGRRSVTVTLH